MSLDGGLDELLEFFSNLANRASNSVILASSTAQLEHRDVVARSSIATPNYPNHLTPTKITLETVNGYQCFYDNLGVCEWLLNDPQKAIESWRGALRTSYGDSSGHMRTKLLLWFSGVMRDDERVRNEAVKLLERAIGTLRGKHWPGAIARYILGKSSEEEVTAAAKVVDQLHNLDRERRLALLYFGAMAYAARDINRAVFCFSQCADGVVAALGESFMHELRLAAFERDRLVGNSSRGEKVVVNTASKARTKKRSNVRKKGAR